MWNPFRSKTKDEDPKKKKKDDDAQDAKNDTPLVQRLKDPEPDASDKRAQEALEKSEDACTKSTIIDAEALLRLKNARAEAETQRKKVVRNAEHISSVLTGEDGETAQERAIRELEEEEARQRA